MVSPDITTTPLTASPTAVTSRLSPSGSVSFEIRDAAEMLTEPSSSRLPPSSFVAVGPPSLTPLIVTETLPTVTPPLPSETL